MLAIQKLDYQPRDCLPNLPKKGYTYLLGHSSHRKVTLHRMRRINAACGVQPYVFAVCRWSSNDGVFWDVVPVFSFRDVSSFLPLAHVNMGFEERCAVE